MTASFGKKIVTTIFGSSHGKSIGVVVDGLPLGEEIDMDELLSFMKRRAPGNGKFTTKRSEKDIPEFIAGVEENKIVDRTICATIRNEDKKSSDYDKFKDLPRPSHADYVSYMKYGGLLDMRGSGSFSGRLTAPLCIAGGIAIQILKKKGIEISSHIKNLGGIKDDDVDYVNPNMEKLKECQKFEIPFLNEEKRNEAKNLLEKITEEKDSIGGEIECFATGIPVGLGEPNYDSFEANLSRLIFSMPGTRAIGFGRGFDAVEMRGSYHNDQFEIKNGKVLTKTNNAGGIVGGITNGMPIVFSVAMKPTASIAIEQDSISLKKKEEEKLIIKGRHDPCIALRSLPVIESILALTILDFMEINNARA